MKKSNIITHPYSVLISFSLVLISGEHIGGFYILYLLMGLPHGTFHSILGISGIIILLLNKMLNSKKENYLLMPILNITGSILMIVSLSIFFFSDEDHYNIATFYQLVPQIFLVVFILLSVSFILKNIHSLASMVNKNIK